jgi:cytidylate kinase
MTANLMIAIDGPAASGKSTIALNLAGKMGYLFFDTGVMYRAVTLAALNHDVAINDESKVTELAERISIDVTPPTQNDGRASTVLLDGDDVTWEIRSSEVEDFVSVVSMYQGVRRAMTMRQREIGLRRRVVMVGRDIGTVVLPEADLKIFLDASVEVRAKRRYEECLARGEEIPFEEILASMKSRDSLDSTRELAPLVAADDAVTIDTTFMSIREVVGKIMSLLDNNQRSTHS